MRLSLIIIAILFSACATNKIEGLWHIQKVKVGNEEMTPVARWVEFHKDGTQQSGNGWVQHSIGTFNFDKKEKSLSIINTNGFVDNSEPFEVSFEEGQMFWNRTEEGQEVQVTLKQGEGLPQSPGDALLGIWKLVKVKEGKKDITQVYDPENKRFIFLRWDRLFSIQNTPTGRLSGVYNVHGHRSELELIFNGEDCERKKWSFEVSHDAMILKSIDTEKEIIAEYRRIDHFIK